LFLLDTYIVYGDIPCFSAAICSSRRTTRLQQLSISQLGKHKEKGENGMTRRV
jgi:hypothetical protein